MAAEMELQGRLDPAEVPELRPEQAVKLLFRVLASEIRDVDDDRLLAEGAPSELVQSMQAEVDKIVTAARARGMN